MQKGADTENRARSETCPRQRKLEGIRDIVRCQLVVIVSRFTAGCSSWRLGPDDGGCLHDAR
eukprot:7515547-Lingulodinium_polyedra.AAC.1